MAGAASLLPLFTAPSPSQSPLQIWERRGGGGDTKLEMTVNKNCGHLLLLLIKSGLREKLCSADDDEQQKSDV